MMPPYGALRGARIVATVPSEQENSGWFYFAAQQQIAALRRYGAEVFPLDVSYAHSGNLMMLFEQMNALNDFGPEMAISTPYAVNALRCKTGNIVAGDGRYVPNNLFLDNLQLPTVLLWDTMAEMFATLGVPSLDPSKSRSGVLADMHAQMNNPLCFHCAIDQRHVDTMRELGVLTTKQVKVRLSGAYPQFVALGETAPEAGYDEAIAFTGNLFSSRPTRGEGSTSETLARLADLVIAAFDRDPGTYYWDAVKAAMAEIGDAACRAAKLIFDESFFWEYVCVDILSAVITRTRLRALAASRHPISVYGLMFDPQSEHLLRQHPHLTAKGRAHFVTGMPRLNRRTKVTLDVVTSHFPNSTTAKILDCFAAGGLCLFDAKPAFRDAFGDAADRLMYRGFDDMNAKLDYLLSHDRERVELADYIRAKVHAEHTSIGLLAEMVAWVKDTTR
jgi:hypothetical protein